MHFCAFILYALVFQYAKKACFPICKMRLLNCTFYYCGLSGETKLFIATVVTQLPFKMKTLKSITSYTGC